MAQFYLLDHSLRKLGGHHLEYATHTLDAAEQMGYDVVLAAHRKFAVRERIPPHWRLFPVYSYTTYQPYRIHERAERTLRKGWRRVADGLSSLASPARELWHKLNRYRRIHSFADATERVFRAAPLQYGDQVFVPTLSEFDLLGLVEFLKRDERTQLADWHLQFHFNVFEGREPEYQRQAERAELVRERLEAPLEQVRTHRIHLYATCDMLARQFNRLDVAKFEPLAYPIDPAIAENRQSKGRQQGPLRVTIAGAVREEKGHQHLQGVLRGLRSAVDGRGKLVIQSNKSWFRLEDEDEQGENGNSSWIEYVPHPLPHDQYAELIRRADIGLLLYDSRRYYARRAGILGEYLAAGKPVIVPAGCWLSEQLVEANYQHLERRMANGQVTPLAELTSVTTGAPASWHTVQANRGDDLLLRFAWDASTTPGSYCRLTLRQNDADSNPISEKVEICGLRSCSFSSAALLSLDERTRFVQVTCDNAYDSTPLHLFDVRMMQLHSANGESSPRSAVGVTFADEQDVGDCAREILDHWDHYQSTALAFGDSWMDKHDPSRTVAQLIQQSAAGQARAA